MHTYMKYCTGYTHLKRLFVAPLTTLADILPLLPPTPNLSHQGLSMLPPKNM